MLVNESTQSNLNQDNTGQINQSIENITPTVIIASNQRSVTTYLNAILREIIKIDSIANVNSIDEATKLINIDTDNKISCILSTDKIHGGVADELLSHLRTTHQDNNIPFIMLTEKQEHELQDILKDNLAIPLKIPFTANHLIDKLFDVFKERDRRQAKRISSSIPCEIKDKNSQKLIIDGKIHDISISGCLIELNEFITDWNQSDNYLIEFVPDDIDVIRLMAKVARTVVDGKKISVGFEFMKIEQNTKWNLEKYIKDRI